MFAIILLIALLGAVSNHGDDANVAVAVLAPSPISVAIVGVTQACKHMTCEASKVE